jgi:proteic killer suppression protein
MEAVIVDEDLRRLEIDASYTAGYSRAIVCGFRKAMQWIRDAVDERDLYVMKSLHYEKLQGQRAHQRSLRINRQWRLIVELQEARPKNIMALLQSVWVTFDRFSDFRQHAGEHLEA